MAQHFQYFCLLLLYGLVHGDGVADNAVQPQPGQSASTTAVGNTQISNVSVLPASYNDINPLAVNPNPAICNNFEGFKCAASCTLLVRCFKSSNVTYGVQTVRRCEGKITTMCRVSSLDCSASICEDDELVNQQAECFEDGVYPNPRNCLSFYNCTNKLRSDFQCSPGTMYDSVQKKCTLKYEKEFCDGSLIPKCSTVNDIGAYARDPNIFYICSYNQNGYLIPVLRRCNVGFEFDVEEGKCNGASLLSMNFTIILLLVTFAGFKEFQ